MSALLPASKDSCPSVRVAAAEMLGALGDRGAKNDVRSALRLEQSEAVAWTMTRVLGTLIGEAK